MTNRPLYVVILAVFASLLTSCGNEMPEEFVDNSNKNYISICVGMPGGDTPGGQRLIYNDPTRSFTWETSDQLRLVGYAADNTFLGVTDLSMKGAPGKTATFEGPAVDKAVHYKIYYPPTAVDNNGVELKKDYTGQVQNGNVNTDHLKQYITLKYLDPVTKKETITLDELNTGTKDITLSMKNSIIVYELLNLSAKDISSLTGITWSIKGGLTLNKKISLGLKNITQNTVSAYICFEEMDIVAKNSIKLSLDGNLPLTKEFKVVSAPANMTYQPNFRYTKSINFSDSEMGKNLFYNGNLQYGPNNFEVIGGKGNGGKPISQYNPETQEGSIEFPEKTPDQQIKLNSFDGIDKNAKEVHVPAGVSVLAPYVFIHFTPFKPLNDIYFHSLDVPQIGNGNNTPVKGDLLFIGRIGHKVRIHVPAESLEKYKTEWAYYADRILPI